MDPVSPITFWMVCALTLMLIGAVIGREVNSWWLRWQSTRKSEKLRNSPSVMRQRLRDYERLNGELASEIDGLKLQLAEANASVVSLEDEVKRLGSRNKFLSNEVRHDPNAKTLALRPSAPGRWVYVESDLK